MSVCGDVLTVYELSKKSKEDSLIKAYERFLNYNTVDVKDIAQLLFLEEDSFTTQASYFSAVDQMTALSLFVQITNAPKDFLLKPLEKLSNARASNARAFEHMQLSKLMLTFSHLLLKEKTQEISIQALSSGAIYYSCHKYGLDNQLLGFSKHLQLSLFCLVVGVLSNSADLIHKGLKGAHFIAQFYDRQAQRFFHLWMTHEEYDPAHLTTLSFLLFRLASALTNSEIFSLFAQTLYTKLTELDPFSFDQMPSYLPMLAIWIDKQTFQASYSANDTLHTIFSHPPVGILKNEQLSCAFTSQGVNTTLGSVFKKDIQIVAIGPQQQPFATLDSFGIYRFCSDQDKNEVITDSAFNAWMRCVKFSNEKLCAMPACIWMNFKANLQDDLEIHTNFHGKLPSHFAFTFYIKAQELKTHMKTYISGSINQYHGEVQPITFQGEENILTLTANGPQHMQIIPLEGKKHFWGANFLVAYEISGIETKCHWNIN